MFVSYKWKQVGGEEVFDFMLTHFITEISIHRSLFEVRRPEEDRIIFID